MFYRHFLASIGLNVKGIKLKDNIMTKTKITICTPERPFIVVDESVETLRVAIGGFLNGSNEQPSINFHSDSNVLIVPFNVASHNVILLEEVK